MLPLAYLASPYTHKNPDVREQRYQQVCDVVTKLSKQGDYAVYSPIAHWHPIALVHKLPTDAMFWKNQNEGVINASQCVIVVKMDGWEQSIGVQMEIAFAKQHNIKIIYVDPEEL